MTRTHENTHWQNMFARFLEYKHRYKHCFVPRSYGRLGLWCDDQRIGYRMLQDGRSTHMTRVKIELLESEGFCWEYENKREKKWHEMYAELMEYKKEHGHCNVPKKCRANQKLGSWVDYQRTLYRQTIKKNTNTNNSSNEGSSGSISVCSTDNNENAMSMSMQLYNPNAITPGRIKLLEDIGFRWSTAKELSNANANTTNVSNKKNKISRNKTKQQTQQSCLVSVSSPDTHSSTNSSTDAPTVISNSSSVNVNGNVNVVPQVKRNASPLELLSMVAASEARNSRNCNVIQKSQVTVVPSNTSAFTARMQQSSSMMTSPRTPTQNQHQHRIVYTTTAHHPAVSTATATTGAPVLIQQVAAPRYEQQYHSYAAHPIAQHHQQQVVRVVHHYRPAAAHQVSTVMARHPIHY